MLGMEIAMPSIELRCTWAWALGCAAKFDDLAGAGLVVDRCASQPTHQTMYFGFTSGGISYGPRPPGSQTWGEPRTSLPRTVGGVSD